MSEIYLITNLINNSKYVGATKRNVDKRKNDYKKSYNNPQCRDYGYKICEAMREYGFENFVFETIEECEECQLGEREKYWIKYYNTIKTGYNEALGGEGKPLWDKKKLRACKELFDNGWFIQDIADIVNSNPKTVSRKLKETYGVDTKENANNLLDRQKVVCIDDFGHNILFNSKSEAARYLQNNNHTKNKDIGSIINKIDDAIINGHKSYGFKWIDK